MRCLTLARALRAEGVRSTFLASPSTAAVLDRFDRAGCGRIAVAQPETPEDLASRAAEALEDGGFAAVVVDNYRWDAALEGRLRAPGRLQLVVDDLADRPHAADVVLDTSFGRTPADYADLAPGAALLLGPEYALVRPEFGLARERGRREPRAPVRRVLVSLGLTDVDGITGRVVEALEPVRGSVTLDVVVGARAPSLERLRELAALDASIRLHVDATDMAELMSAADLAVGAGGSATWERATLGLPTLTLLLAPNQETFARRLTDAGAALTVDAREPGFEEALRAAWTRLMQDGELRADLSARSAALCDGAGAARVAAKLAEILRGDGLRVRPAETSDAEDVWRWRNDAESRSASRQTDEVPWPEHEAWFARAIRDPDKTLLIGSDPATGEKVGLVRLDRRADGARLVGINIAPEQRGRGHGTRLLKAALAAAGSDRLIAEVRKENARSMRLFEEAGFRRVGAADGFVTLQRDSPG